MRRDFWQRHTAIRKIGPAYRATHPPDVAVKPENLAVASQVVESVDVLRDEREPWLLDFQFHQRAVSGVRRGFGDDLAAPVVPLPYQARIARERLGCRQFFRLVVLPQAACAAEGRDAALGGDAGARQDRHGVRLCDPCSYFFDVSQLYSIESGELPGWTLS